jgi:hypothetical protein
MIAADAAEADKATAPVASKAHTADFTPSFISNPPSSGRLDTPYEPVSNGYSLASLAAI